MLTDVQRRTRAEPLVYMNPLADVTFVRQVNQTNATIPHLYVTERAREGERANRALIEPVKTRNSQNTPPPLNWLGISYWKIC